MQEVIAFTDTSDSISSAHWGAKALACKAKAAERVMLLSQEKEMSSALDDPHFNHYWDEVVEKGRVAKSIWAETLQAYDAVPADEKKERWSAHWVEVSQKPAELQNQIADFQQTRVDMIKSKADQMFKDAKAAYKKARALNADHPDFDPTWSDAMMRERPIFAACKRVVDAYEAIPLDERIDNKWRTGKIDADDHQKKCEPWLASAHQLKLKKLRDRAQELLTNSQTTKQQALGIMPDHANFDELWSKALIAAKNALLISQRIATGLEDGRDDVISHDDLKRSWSQWSEEVEANIKSYRAELTFLQQEKIEKLMKLADDHLKAADLAATQAEAADVYQENAFDTVWNNAIESARQVFLSCERVVRAHQEAKKDDKPMTWHHCYKSRVVALQRQKLNRLIEAATSLTVAAEDAKKAAIESSAAGTYVEAQWNDASEQAAKVAPLWRRVYVEFEKLVFYTAWSKMMEKAKELLGSSSL